MNLYIKKIIIVLFILIIVFNSSNGFLKPESAKAVLSNVATDLAVEAWQAIRDYAISAWDNIVDNYQIVLRDIIAKRLIDYIVDQTIVWIQGGGEPKFISNWDGFLKDAGAIAQDSVIQEVGLSPLCSPFKLQVKLSLLPVERFRTRITCTLDDIVKNIEDFYADFENGGWFAYNAAWQPQNNYFGMILIAQDEIMVRSAAKIEASQNEVRASGGFLGVKKCYSTDADKSKWIEECMAAPGWVDQQTAMDTCVANAQTVKIPCSNEKIMTPGTAVGQAVGSAITSDKEWAANIQSWTSALVNAFINRVTEEGIAYLQGSDSSDDSYYPPEYQDEIDRAFGEDKQTMIKEPQKFADEWQYLLNAKNKSLSYVQQQKGVLEQLKLVQTATSSQPLPPACSPLVADIEIQNLQTEIGRLTDETQNLQEKIEKTNSLINTINSVDFSNIKQRSLTQSAYMKFINKYNTSELQMQIISGDARTVADSKATAKQNDLTVGQNRLKTCQEALQAALP